MITVITVLVPVPSKKRPQPPTKSVSPENRIGFKCGLLGLLTTKTIWPFV